MSFPLHVNHVNSRVVNFVNWLQVKSRCSYFFERQDFFLVLNHKSQVYKVLRIV